MVKKDSRLLPKVLLVFIAVVYFYLLVKVILFKFGGFDPQFVSNQLWNSLNHPEDILRRLQYRGNLIPLNEITNNLQHILFDFNLFSFINFVGNMVAFMPLGFLVPLLFSKRAFSLMVVVVVSLLVSLSFELTQLVLSIGTFDVDDLLLNTTGGAIGFLLLKLNIRMVKAAEGRTKWLNGQTHKPEAQKL